MHVCAVGGGGVIPSKLTNISKFIEEYLQEEDKNSDIINNKVTFGTLHKIKSNIRKFFKKIQTLTKE